MPKFRSQCLREVTILVAVTRDLLHKVVTPTLVIHAHEDHVVPAANAMEVVKTIKSDDIRLLWLTNSYHVATLDNDKDLSVERVGGFFNEIANAGRSGEQVEVGAGSDRSFHAKAGDPHPATTGN